MKGQSLLHIQNEEYSQKFKGITGELAERRYAKKNLKPLPMAIFCGRKAIADG